MKHGRGAVANLGQVSAVSDVTNKFINDFDFLDFLNFLIIFFYQANGLRLVFMEKTS